MKLFLFVLLTLTVAISAITPFAANGSLHVDPITGQLRNEDDEPVQLRGMSSHGLQWFGNVINETSLRALQENWRADVIRLSTYVQEGGYEKMPAVMEDFVDQRVEWASALGLYVIIDFHMLAPGNPWENIDYARDFFTHMAQTHGQRDNIFYEICNEPNNEPGMVKNYYTGKKETIDSTNVTWDMIKSYADSITSVIRKYDDRNIILVGTPNWCQDVDAVIDDRLEDPQTMYTTHFYAASHKEYERDKLRTALENNVPVFVTEFGTQEYTGDGFNDYESTEEWFALLDSFSVSWVNWNFSYHEFNGAAFDKYPGDLNDYDYYAEDSNLKDAGKWVKAQLQKPDSWEPITPVSSHISLQTGFPRFQLTRNMLAVDLTESTFSLFSVNGREILSGDVPFSGEYHFSTPLAPGVYLLSVKQKGIERINWTVMIQ